MNQPTVLNETEVKSFVDRWFHSLDIHVPLETFLAMVTDEDNIQFRFPEVTVSDKAGLTAWYRRVTTTFFDEQHQTVKLATMLDGESATIKLTTHWQASTWKPPEAHSERVDFLASQTWKVRRSSKNGQVVIVSYIVDTFDPIGDSHNLPHPKDNG